MKNIIYDLETRPSPPALEMLLAQELSFDEANVKTGNLKDEAKIQEKIEHAKLAHEHKMNLWRADQKKKCQLDPDYGMISCIGILHVESHTYEYIDATDEVKALTRWWELVEQTTIKGSALYGWNTNSFDLPFLFHRSRINGVRYDPYLITRDRYFADCFVDLHQVWTFGAFGKYTKLSKANLSLGYWHKEQLEVSGASFSDYYHSGDEDKRKQALEYLKLDLDMTMRVAKSTHGLKHEEPYTEDIFGGDAQ